MYFKSHHDYNLQEHEARMDELEGTLRGHIGLIEESLERSEGQKSGGKGQKAYVHAFVNDCSFDVWVDRMFADLMAQ